MLHDGSWPNFELTWASVSALDRGEDLPNSLRTLLNTFFLTDAPWNGAYDIGRYEYTWSGPLYYTYLPSILQKSDR